MNEEDPLAPFRHDDRFRPGVWPCCGIEILLGPAATEGLRIRCVNCGTSCAIVAVDGVLEVRRVEGSA